MPGGSDDCDGDPTNGRGTDLSRSVTSCGSCGTACVNVHGSTSCARRRIPLRSVTPGTTTATATPPMAARLRRRRTLQLRRLCFTCDTSFQVCAGQTCRVAMCRPRRGDCDSVMTDGETDLTNSLNSCGFLCPSHPGSDPSRRPCPRRRPVYNPKSRSCVSSRSALATGSEPNASINVRPEWDVRITDRVSQPTAWI